MGGVSSTGTINATVTFKDGPDLEVFDRTSGPVATAPGTSHQVPLKFRNAGVQAITGFAVDVELTKGLTWKQPPANCKPTTSTAIHLNAMTCTYNNQTLASAAEFQLPEFNLLVEPYAFGELKFRATSARLRSLRAT